MNWFDYPSRSWPLPYVHSWPGKAKNRSTFKHHEARTQRAKARKRK